MAFHAMLGQISKCLNCAIFCLNFPSVLLFMSFQAKQVVCELKTKTSAEYFDVWVTKTPPNETSLTSLLSKYDI